MSRLSMDIQLSAAIQWEAAGIMSPQAWSAHTINYQLAATLEKRSLLLNQQVFLINNQKAPCPNISIHLECQP